MAQKRAEKAQKEFEKSKEEEINRRNMAKDQVDFEVLCYTLVHLKMNVSLEWDTCLSCVSLEWDTYL